jgi:two-component system, OmpR family, alkaline phosphatase synthesis response regulator PhoP
MKPVTVLVVDDEHNIRNLLRMYLVQAGYEVIEAEDGETALRYVNGSPSPDVIILDLMLPGLDGLEVCRKIRASDRRNLPVLMLTARDDDVDKIVGLELGADDYITKPFNPREVVARIKAVLRRFTSGGFESRDRQSLYLADVVLDREKRQVIVAGEIVEFRRREFDLLEALLQQPEVVLSRAQLLDQVWGYDYLGQTRTVDVHIAAVRRKLETSRVQIETVIGVGYRITTA